MIIFSAKTFFSKNFFSIDQIKNVKTKNCVFVDGIFQKLFGVILVYHFWINVGNV